MALILLLLPLLCTYARRVGDGVGRIHVLQVRYALTVIRRIEKCNAELTHRHRDR